MTEIQVIANMLKIPLRENDRELCLLIQDKLKEITNENNKLKFTNQLVKKQLESKRDEVNIISKKLNEMEYADKFNKNKNITYKKFRDTISEQENLIVNLKQELKYYESKLKLNRVG